MWNDQGKMTGSFDMFRAIFSHYLKHEMFTPHDHDITRPPGILTWPRVLMLSGAGSELETEDGETRPTGEARPGPGTCSPLAASHVPDKEISSDFHNPLQINFWNFRAGIGSWNIHFVILQKSPNKSRELGLDYITPARFLLLNSMYR